MIMMLIIMRHMVHKVNLHDKEDFVLVSRSRIRGHSFYSGTNLLVLK